MLTGTTYVFRVYGRSVKVFLNGELTTECDTAPGPVKGRLALQLFGPNTTVECSNIRIRSIETQPVGKLLTEPPKAMGNPTAASTASSQPSAAADEQGSGLPVPTVGRLTHGTVMATAYGVFGRPSLISKKCIALP